MRPSIAIPAATFLVVAAPLVTNSGTAAAPVNATPTSATFGQETASSVVTKLADSLQKYFVFPDVGNAYATMLRAKLAAGAYARLPSAAAFATAVNADLQRVHKDGHLELFAPGASPYANHPEPKFIEKAGWIAPGVAYIRFFAFPGDEKTLASLEQFLNAHAQARSLIIDARDHHGGGIAEMDLIFSKIFAKSTRLIALDTRSTADAMQKMPFVQLPSVRAADSPPGYVRRVHWAIPSGVQPLTHAKVYLLTSHETVSAAEHLAFALKRTHRATLIGETTRGADHFGTDLELPGGFEAFLPVGRAVDPVTGEDWEPGGVRPNVDVPARMALIVALEKSGLSHADAVRINAQQPKFNRWGRPA